MNKIISINIKGIILQIEEDAYERLKAYLEALKQYFDRHESKEEILDDIEMGIADMLNDILKNKASISLQDVEGVIQRMGNPKDFAGAFDDEESKEEKQNSTSDSKKTSRKRRLFRDPDNKVIGGVSSGIAAYFNMDPVWIRLFFVIGLFFGMSPIIYIILWAVMPEAKTMADKLEMKGENVTIENLEKRFQEEFSKIKEDLNSGKFGNKVGDFAEKSGRVLADVLKRILSIFGKIIGFGLVIFGLSLLVFMSLVLISAYTGTLDVPFTGIWNLFRSSGEVYHLLAISAFFVIFIPVISIIIGGIGLIAGRSIFPKGSWVKASVGGVWFISLLCLAGCLFYGFNQFSDQYKIEDKIVLNVNDSLTIKSDGPQFIKGLVKKNNAIGVYYNDSVFRKVNLSIRNSKDSSFYLEISKSSNGADVMLAEQNAKMISENYSISGNELLLSPYFQIVGDFRNQEVEMRVFIPQGKVFKVEKEILDYLMYRQGYEYENHEIADQYLMLVGDELLCLSCDSALVSRKEKEKLESKFINFNSIKISGAFDVKIRKADRYSYQLLNPNGRNIRAEQNGNTLELEILGPGALADGMPVVIINTPDLSKIVLEGANSVDLDWSGDNNIEIRSEGANQVKGNLECNNLILRVEGVGNIDLRGKSEFVEIKSEGGSKINLSDLESKYVEVVAEGVSSIEVWAIDRLKVKMEGTAVLKYKGNPSIEQENSGLAKIERKVE